MRWHALAMASVLAGCASTPSVPPVRFVNAPPVTAVDDRHDVPRRPATPGFNRHLYHFDGSFYRLITRALELPRARRALGINALDEVPDSTWFTNRIGARELTLDELRTGPATVGSPEPHKPWTIHSTKVGGATVGFIITDARGEKFLLKFDRAGHPETETAAEVIVSKLMWALGYNVAEDHVVYVRRSDLLIAPGAVIKDWSGVRGPLDRTELERKLDRCVSEPDGQLRAMASHMIEGKALGGHAGEGVRRDDPNDRIPHELRRDLRGAYAMFAWLDYTDIKEDNSLDMWVTDPENPRRHHVKHYRIDFGTSLGAAGLFQHDLRQGHAYAVDFPVLFESFVTAGLGERSWLDRSAPALRGVGLYEAARYDPGAWKPETPAYLPLRIADAHDNFWGAKILMRFSREQLRAVVETARLSDPRAVDYLVNTLVARQRATGRYWFSRVNPLDRFAMRTGGLCFDDLMLVHRLMPASATTYSIRAFDRRGAPLGSATGMTPAAAGRTCTPLTLAGDGDGYTIVRIDTARSGGSTTIYVHLAREPVTREPRVIGLWRP